jgi:pimeloyl-ACP methyl ester carboxylesterase
MPQAQINDISIEYDVQGPADGEPVLLIMGLGSQLTRWGPVFIEKLVGAGYARSGSTIAMWACRRNSPAFRICRTSSPR